MRTWLGGKGAQDKVPAFHHPVQQGTYLGKIILSQDNMSLAETAGAAKSSGRGGAGKEECELPSVCPSVRPMSRPFASTRVLQAHIPYPLHNSRGHPIPAVGGENPCLSGPLHSRWVSSSWIPGSSTRSTISPSMLPHWRQVLAHRDKSPLFCLCHYPLHTAGSGLPAGSGLLLQASLSHHPLASQQCGSLRHPRPRP